MFLIKKTKTKNILYQVVAEENVVTMFGMSELMYYAERFVRVKQSNVYRKD